MTERTLADEIITIIESVANNNPAPQHCTILKTYDDGCVDVITPYQYYKYVVCYGDNTPDTEGVVIFVNGDETQPLVITSGGGGDLSDYIKKSTTAGLVKNDGSIDTTSYSTFDGDYDSLTNKPTIPTDVSDLTDTHNTPFTPKTHNHNTWTSTTLNTNATLYVNEALHLCELKYTRSFSRASGYTEYSWASTIIPATYCPAEDAYGTGNNGGIIFITPTGDIKGYITQTLEARFTLNASVMWHY